MSQLRLHTDAENARHAVLFYSLCEENVTPSELQEMAGPTTSPLASIRDAKIRRMLKEHGALKELPDLATKCAMVPELLMADGSDDPEVSIARRQLLCVVQALMVEGLLERKGTRAFVATQKLKSMDAPPPQAKFLECGFTW
jgi:hypothetical protein